MKVFLVFLLLTAVFAVWWLVLKEQQRALVGQWARKLFKPLLVAAILVGGLMVSVMNYNIKVL